MTRLRYKYDEDEQIRRSYDSLDRPFVADVVAEMAAFFHHFIFGRIDRKVGLMSGFSYAKFENKGLKMTFKYRCTVH